MRILLTGSSKGIGRAIALRLARAGNCLALCASSSSGDLASVVAECQALGAEAEGLAGDLADGTVPGRLVSEAVARFGGLEAVISNAGIVVPGKLAELPEEAWDRIFSVNTRGPWLLARAAYPHLKATAGSFTAVASMSGVEPYPGTGAYSPAKAALIMMIRVLAQEWAADGIRANAVSPGIIETPMTAPIYTDPAKKAAREALVPMHRIGQPDDIAAKVAFLVSPDASYMTGQNLLVDGGLLGSIQGHLAGRPASERER